MKAIGMHRMRKALAAIKMAEMARLGRLEAELASLRADAADLRKRSCEQTAGANSSEMIAVANWQVVAEARARAKEAEAAELLDEIQTLRSRLARTNGREMVTNDLIRQSEVEAGKLAERRAEDVPANKRPMS